MRYGWGHPPFEHEYDPRRMRLDVQPIPRFRFCGADMARIWPCNALCACLTRFGVGLVWLCRVGVLGA